MKSAHDVAAAYLLAMQEVWVRLPLGALRKNRTGRGIVWLVRVLWAHETAGSNPDVLTDPVWPNGKAAAC